MGSDRTRELEVIDNRDEFIQAVALAAEVVLESAITSRGQAHLVLTGGTMGIAVLTGFRVGKQARIDWSRVHFWWGDERFVSSDSADRNALQARRAFLEAANIPLANIHEMPATDSGLTLEEAAQKYADTLSSFGGVAGIPDFDLTFLGIGPDSHVASLFPDHADALATGLCIPVRNSPKPPPERISLTYESLNRSKRIWIVAFGSDKADAVEAMFTHDGNLSVPSSCVYGSSQTKLWADTAAASLVTD